MEIAGFTLSMFVPVVCCIGWHGPSIKKNCIPRFTMKMVSIERSSKNYQRRRTAFYQNCHQKINYESWQEYFALEMAFESTGIVRTKRADNGAIWTYLECCPELGRYYRMWCQRPVYYQIHKPSWNEHISITRAEVILDKDYLEKIEGKELSFRYAHHIISDSKRFWLCVESEDLLDMRWNLGLPRQPLVSFHLTIGVNIGYRSDREPK